MKLRRMKLVALAMSALMVTSALPMTAFAEEEVFYEEVADEVLVGDSAEEETYFEDGIVFEEDADAVEEDADFVFEEEGSFEETVGDPHSEGGSSDSELHSEEWNGENPVSKDNKWWITLNVYDNGNKTGTKEYEVTGTPKTTEPTCTTDGKIEVTFTKDEKVGFVPTGTIVYPLPRKGGEHDFSVRAEKTWNTSAHCSPDASYTYKLKCSRCGALDTQTYTAEAAKGRPADGQKPATDQFEDEDLTAHDPESVVTVTIDKNSLVNLKLKDENQTVFSSIADAKANVELIVNTKKGYANITIAKYCKICNTTEYYDSEGNVVSFNREPTEAEKLVVVPAEFRDYKYAKVVDLLPDEDNDLDPGVPNVRGLVAGKNTAGEVNGAGKKVLFREDFIGAHSDEPDALIDKEGKLRSGVLERLALANCAVAGAYKVAFYDDDDDLLAYSDWIDIPAHHVYGVPVFEFKNDSDRSKCTPIFTAKRDRVDYFATNCVTDITYETVYHCLSFGECPLKDCKVAKVYSSETGAQLTGTALNLVGNKVDPEKKTSATAQKIVHTYSKIKDRVKTLIDQAAIKGTKVSLNDLEKLILVDPTGKTAPRTDLIDKDVRIKNNNICDEGTVTVEYVCKKCGHVDSVDIAVGARDHLKGDLIMKVEKEATCTETGKNIATANCVYCGKELDKKENIIAKKPHSNQKEVTVSTKPKKIETEDRVHDEYAWSHAMIGVMGSVVVGPKAVIPRNDNIHFYKGELTSDITKGYRTDAWGVGTSIGYYDTVGQTDEDEFLGVQFYLFTPCEWCGDYLTAVNAKPADGKNDYFKVEVVDSKEPARNDVAGSITLTATYKHNDRVISVGPVTYPWYKSWASYAARSDGNKTDESGNPDTHVHKEGVATIANLVEATCDKAGSYDLVSKCTECGEVVNTIHVLTEAKEHKYGSWLTSKKATVFTAGTQKRTCANCKNVETKSIAKLPSIIKLNKTAVTVKVGKSATVKVSKWNLKDYIAPTAEGGVKASNKNVSAFKTGSYTLKIKGKKAGSSTVTVKMKAGATATIKVTVKK